MEQAAVSESEGLLIQDRFPVSIKLGASPEVETPITIVEFLLSVFVQ